MDRDFRRGYLEITSPAARFDSPLRLLDATFRLFASRLGFIAGLTLLVYLPGHLLYQFAAAALDIPSNGILSFALMEAADLVLSSLAIPAIVYGLLRDSATMRHALSWGRRQWMRTLTRQVLVEVTVLLYGALLIVPGLIAMVRLALVPVIVAVEADRQAQPLPRSRDLARGRMWRIVAVLFPLGLLDLAANFLLLGRITGIEQARVIFALAETGLAIVSQLTTVATLLIYLGCIEPPAAPPRKHTPAVRSR
ncbi:MAG: hypothetical protein JST11_13360 [Acidobacteria bacterium]|nr:hypothetical protein [Acidobacteriota bacterium]